MTLSKTLLFQQATIIFPIVFDTLHAISAFLLMEEWQNAAARVQNFKIESKNGTKITFSFDDLLQYNQCGCFFLSYVLCDREP